MLRPWRAAILLVGLLAASTGRAQVDCDTPDDLCTGDPCVIGVAEVDDSCVLDFGARTVVVAGTLKLPNSGELSITAQTIQITGRVQNLPSSSAGPGPRITLVATGDIDMDGRIRLTGVRGVLVPGRVMVQAGGNLLARSALTATTSPTSISLSAASGNIDFTGRVNTPKAGGEIAMVAGGRIDSLGTLRRLDRVDMSAGGSVQLGGRLSARESMTVDSAHVLTLETTLRDTGSDVALRGALGVTVQKSISLTPLFVDDGSAELTSSSGNVVVSMPVRANDISITAGADVTIDALVSASPPARSGGSIVLESTGGVITTFADLVAQSGDGTAPGDGAGGQVRLTAQGPVTVGGDVLVNAFPGKAGAPGGTVQIEGASVLVGPGARLDADGDAPGPEFPGAPSAGFRFTSTTGDVVLDGTFNARGGPSVIQGTAAGSLVAVGDYRVAPDGCIGLSAGGTLTTGGATFDTPVVATCP